MQDEDVINTQDLVNPEEQPQQAVLQEQEVKETKPVEQPKEQPKETMPQKSFRLIREEKEKIERERDEMRRKLEALENAKKDYNPVDANTGIEDLDVPEEDYVEGKHINKMAKKIKQLEKQIEQSQQQSSLMTTESRLRAEYPDFDKVVSKDNIEVLNLTYPELAASISSTPDMYIKAKSAYTLIKKLGIEQDMTSYEQENERANKNLAKPKPAVNVSQNDSPLSMANAFASASSKEARMKIYKQAQEYSKNKGFI